MKRICTVAWAFLTAVTLLAQGRVNTRKHILSDFTDKVTQVVLSGDEVLNTALRQEVVNLWTASPYEFCTLEQFESRKTQDRYYFLLPAESRFKGEEHPGILFLTLVKGGPKAAEGIGEMTEIISLPLTASAGGTGREIIYLGALLQAIQEFTLSAMGSEKVAYGMEGWANQNYAKYGKMKQIYLVQADLDASVTNTILERYADSDIHIVEDAEQADQAYLDGEYNTLVGYVVAPFLPENGASWCYKMLFEAESHRLYYFHKHKISQKNGVGFTAEDLKRMARKR